MSPDTAQPQWLVWAREIQALAQTGLAFTTGHYDIQRYTRLMKLAADIVAQHAGLKADSLSDTFLAQPGYATPKVDVRGAVVRDGKILLVQERVDARWCMPGGWADVDELPSAMVAREVIEESGLVVRARKVVGVFDANRTGVPREFYHAYKVVFLCDEISGDLRSSDETLAAAFFSFDELPPLSSPRTEQRHLDEVRAHLVEAHRQAAFD
jgi:ADP-ribose pyrophosphatase YjhB (NUDIX family)